MVCPVIHEECAAAGAVERLAGKLWEGEYEETMVYTDYMWVDISNWEFGRMHEEIRNLSTQGWEVDGVVEALKIPGGGGEPAVSLRLKRQRKY